MNFKPESHICDLISDLDGDGYFEKLTYSEEAKIILELCENTHKYVEILGYKFQHSNKKYIIERFHSMYFSLAFYKNLKYLIKDMLNDLNPKLALEELPHGKTSYELLRVLFDDKLFEMQAFMYYSDVSMQEQLILQFHTDKKEELINKLLLIYGLANK